MLKEPADLGYFVSKDQTPQNADNVCVLVIHYDFKEAKAQLAELPQVTQLEIKNLDRSGDDKDVENLKKTFNENRNCNFHSESPEKEKLLKLLSDQDMLLKQFGCSDVPSVFVLYILSHGGRDGVILTDRFVDNFREKVREHKSTKVGPLNTEELFVSFTTTEIFDSLKKLTAFEDCLKFINFGPCRGELKDAVYFESQKIDENFKNENSCRITYSPLMRNTVVFFSTVETTMAKRYDTTGTTFARLTCDVLNSLEKDETLINVLATIQNESHKDAVKEPCGQTPEVKMFSQDMSFFISKSPSVSTTSDAMGNKREFYSWKSKTGEHLRRRLAYLFSADAEQNEQLKETSKALSQNLAFETSELSEEQWKSINEASNLDSNIGCIFLIFFGLVCEKEGTNEVCVHVDNRETTVSEILRKFIGPKTEKWIGKPKIIFLVNQDTSAFEGQGTIQPYMGISATNHSGWLVLVLHHKDELEKLIKIFEGQELKRDKSLQELLASLLISESKGNRDFLNSTLQYLLNFPDRIVKPTFSLTNPDKTRKEYDFDSLVEKSAGNNQIRLLSSVAGSGKTTILGEMAYHFSKQNPELKILHISLPIVPFRKLSPEVNEIEFLAEATRYSPEEIAKGIENKQYAVFLDGFDEIVRTEYQDKTLKVIETLETKQISVWVGTRPHEVEAIKKRISSAVLVEIDPLNWEQQIELYQLETGKSREESKSYIENFASKDILRNPLHLSLVAKHGAEGNLYQIYNKVVLHKLDLFLRDREGLNEKDPKFQDRLVIALERLQEIASCYIRGLELTDDTRKDLENINDSGIATFQNNEVIFIHQTFAEFLAAQHFLREIDDIGKSKSQTRIEDRASIFYEKSSSWGIKFVNLFYCTNDEKIEKHKASYLPVMKLNPDKFLELIVDEGCINIFKMIYQYITFINNREGYFISVTKDETLLIKAIVRAEEIAIMMLETDLMNSDEELLIILPHLLKLVAETNATRFFKELKEKFTKLPEMITSRRFLIDAGLIAARKNHDEILELLLQSGVDINFVESGFLGGNALYIAIQNGDMKCVEILLKHGAKLAIDRYGVSWDPLIVAVKRNDLDMVKFLLEENISGLQRNKETFEINEVKTDLNALHFAIRGNHKDIAKLLIKKSPSLKNVEIGHQGSPLQISAKNKYLEMCQWLVDEEGEDVNTLRPSGDPRDWSLDDNIFIDHFLVLQKTDVNMTDERGKTALHCAAQYGYLERVQELIHSGANIRAVDENGWNAFHFACKSDSRRAEKVIRLLHSIDSQLAKDKTKSGQTGLHLLAKLNYCSDAVTRFLVEEIGVDVRVEDNKGCTALRIAVNEEDNEFVDYLMTKDINLDFKVKGGKTCLHVAAEEGDLEALQTWIELGGNLDVVDEEGSTALHYAVEEGHLQFVEKLLVCVAAESTSPNIGDGSVGSTLKVRVNRCDNRGRTALHLAAKTGNVDLVEMLLENHADLTQTDLEGKNAIYYAIRNEGMLQFLNEKNGNLVKQRLKDGSTILHERLNSGFYSDRDKIAQWIIEKVDDTVLNAKNASGETPLLLACKALYLNEAKLLLSRNVKVNVANRSGKTAMHFAAERGKLDLVKLLHEKGADLTLTDSDGMNTLLHAAKRGNLDLVKLLHEKGADLNLTDNRGRNALHHAIKHFEVVLFLHEKNNELLGQRLKDGDTTLHLALKKWDVDTDTILWLVDQLKNDLNVSNSEGQTPLMLACECREWNIAKNLLKKGVDVHLKDKKGRTALHYAVNRYGNLHAFDLVQELCKRGADLALTDNDGMNAFHHAIRDLNMAVFIHELNGDLVKQRLNNGDTSLHLASKFDDNNILNWLLKQCKNCLNVKNNEGETPLLLACKRKKWINAKNLVAKGADIHVKDRNGRTALYYTVRFDICDEQREFSAFDLVKELHERGADLALTDNDGMNAFHHAIENFHMATFIHELNGDLVKQCLNNGDTSLHLAIKLCRYDSDDYDDYNIRIWLVEQGVVDLNATNALNETPLILACKEKLWDEKFFEKLLSKNVDVNIRDNEGKSARDYIDDSCPTRLLRRFDELEEASPSKKMRMS